MWLWAVRLRVAIACLLLVVLPGSALAVDVLLNNGLGPPDPANVIDHATYAVDTLYVRNFGCPPAGDLFDPCPAPGAATDLSLEAGGAVGWIYTYDSSRATMEDGGATGGAMGAYNFGNVTLNGGTVGGDFFTYSDATGQINGGTVNGALAGYHDSTIELLGGSLQYYVFAFNNARIVLAHGPIGGQIWALDNSHITIRGRALKLDGAPVSYGDLTVSGGTLTGHSPTHDAIDNVFSIVGTSSITLERFCDDQDGDGYGVDGDPICPNGNQPDCDDTDAAVFPGYFSVCARN